MMNDQTRKLRIGMEIIKMNQIEVVEFKRIIFGKKKSLASLRLHRLKQKSKLKQITHVQ